MAYLDALGLAAVASPASTLRLDGDRQVEGDGREHGEPTAEKLAGERGEHAPLRLIAMGDPTAESWRRPIEGDGREHA